MDERSGHSGEVEEFLTGTRQMVPSDRVLATVLFSDIVGSTEQASEIGDRVWTALLEQHDRAIDRQLARFGGRLIKQTGDGVLATFDGPARGVQCGVAIRDALRQLGIAVRIGVHTGEIERRGDDVAGVAVHIANVSSPRRGRERYWCPGQSSTSLSVRTCISWTVANTSSRDCRARGACSPSEPDTHGQFKLTGHSAACWLPRARDGGAEVSGTNRISVKCQGGTAPGITRNSFVQDHADQRTFVVGRLGLDLGTLASDEMESRRPRELRPPMRACLLPHDRGLTAHRSIEQGHREI